MLTPQMLSPRRARKAAAGPLGSDGCSRRMVPWPEPAASSTPRAFSRSSSKVRSASKPTPCQAFLAASRSFTTIHTDLISRAVLGCGPRLTLSVLTTCERACSRLSRR